MASPRQIVKPNSNYCNLLNEPEPVIVPMPMLMFPPLVVADTKLVVNSGIADPRARI